MTFWQKLDEFPPIVCRLLARTRADSGGIRPLSTDEIASVSGLGPTEVMSISWKCDWRNVDINTIRAFTEGCQVLLETRDNLRKHAAYIRHIPTWKYLLRSPEWSTLYQPLALAYLEHRARAKA